MSSSELRFDEEERDRRRFRRGLRPERDVELVKANCSVGGGNDGATSCCGVGVNTNGSGLGSVENEAAH